MEEEKMVEETLKEEALRQEADAGTEPKEEEASPAEQEAPEEKPSGGPFGGSGKEKKKKKKDKLEEKIEELEDRVMRQMAEFDNFRKRTEKEKSHMYEVGARDVIEKILPVVDNFERGIKSIPEEEREAPVASGMEMIYKQLMTVLTDLGVTPIEAVGQEFDPNVHNAVMHVENEELGENIVAEEFQKGYQYKDAVLRYSMVSVAN